MKKTDIAEEVVGPAAGSGALVPLEPMLRIRGGLDALAKEARVFDLTVKAEEKAARELRRRCVSLRSSLDEAYETVNRPLLDTQKAARKLLAELKDAILKIEAPVDEAIKAAEAEAERLRRARLEAEAARIAGLRQRIILTFVDPLLRLDGLSADELGAIGQKLATAATDDFGDLAAEAETQRKYAVERVLTRQATRIVEEREAAERAEARRREAAEAAERRKAEEAERAERQRIADAEQAERERANAEEAKRLAHERAAFAEEQRQANDRRAGELREWQQRVEREQAEQRAKDEAARKERERLAAEEAQRRREIEETRERIARAAPTMLAALRMTDDSLDALMDGKLVADDMLGTLLQVRAAIEEATGEKAAALLVVAPMPVPVGPGAPLGLGV